MGPSVGVRENPGRQPHEQPAVKPCLLALKPTGTLHATQLAPLRR